MTSGRLGVCGRHGGQQARRLPRGERTSPAGCIDARQGHQPAGCCSADARQRPHYCRDPHPAWRFLVLSQDLGEAEPALPQLIPDLLALRVHTDGLEPSGFALLGFERWRDGFRVRAVS
jgi:hypothetical protein